MNRNNPSVKKRKRIVLKRFLRDVCLPDLKAKYPYFNV